MSRRFVRAHPFGSQKAKRKISGKSVSSVPTSMYWRSLTHFMLLLSLSLYTPWKHQKTRGFLMFSGVWKENLAQNGLRWVSKKHIFNPGPMFPHFFPWKLRDEMGQSIQVWTKWNLWKTCLEYFVPNLTKDITCRLKIYLVHDAHFG